MHEFEAKSIDDDLNVSPDKPEKPIKDRVSKELYDSELENILCTVEKYILSTYGEHYVGNGQIQEIDNWESRGSLMTTSRDTCSKYLTRFGKKSGKNEKDLLKAFHYLVLMYYAAREEGFDK